MYRIIKNRSKAFITICTALAFLSIFALSSKIVKAKGLDNPIKIRQYITINGSYSKPNHRFTYVMEPLTKDAPLPDGSYGKYEFDLVGDQEKYLDIDFQSEGYYSYRLYQKKNLVIKNLTQDEEEYTINIRVEREKTDFKARVYMIVNRSKQKSVDLEFTNKYKIVDKTDEITGKSPNTGDSTSLSIQLILICSSIVLLVFLYKKERKDRMS